MEFDIVPQIVIVFSMAIIILILGRSVSKVKETPDDFLFENKDEEKEKEKFLYLCKRLTRRINKEKYQEKVDSFWIWFEKALRKLRINFLRLDNKIVSALDKVKEKNVETETETENKDQQWENGNLKDGNNNIKAKDENMYVDNKETERSDNKGVGDSFISKTEDDALIISDDIDKKGDNNEGDKDNVETNELNIKNINKKGKEKEYIDLILKNPVDIKSYWKLGIIYSRKKNYKDAISCFRQITKIDPTYTKAKKKIVDLVGRMKKKEK